MDQKDILSRVDHTLLKQEATWEQIREICDDGVKYGCASVCIPASFVRQAAEHLGGRLPVCTVIGFPNGYSTTAVKVFEAQDAIQNGADEIDMVINLGMAKSGDWDGVEREIKAVKEACNGRILKVIVEACQLTQEEKVAVCKAVSLAGADFIKTSTGFSTGGATVEDVALFKAHIAPNVRIKAAGGIRSFQQAQAMLDAGADRLGASALAALMEE